MKLDLFWGGGVANILITKDLSFFGTRVIKVELILLQKSPLVEVLNHPYKVNANTLLASLEKSFSETVRTRELITLHINDCLPNFLHIELTY